MRCFCADLAASQAALLPGLNRKTVNRYVARFRAAIVAAQERSQGTQPIDGLEPWQSPVRSL